MKHGFVRVAAAIPHVEVADCKANAEQIQQIMLTVNAQGVEVLCFPELSLTGYTCQDIFFQHLLIEEAESAMLRLVEFSRNLNVITLVGLPVAFDGQLFDCAAVIQGGKLLGLVPKTYTSNHKTGDGTRWFSPAAHLRANQSLTLCGQEVPFSPQLIFKGEQFSFGIELGHDLGTPIPPSTALTAAGADIIFNLSATAETIGQGFYLRQSIRCQSLRCHCGYVYASCGYGESTQDTVFAGHAYIAENGNLLAVSKLFSMKEQVIVSEIDVELLQGERRAHRLSDEACPWVTHTQACATVSLPYIEQDDSDFRLTRPIKAHPFVPEGAALEKRCEEILFIQSEGLAKRLAHTHAKTAVIGISGGLDSTLALLVTIHAFDRLGLDHKGIVGITMPGFGTTDRTYNNAVRLMKNLGISVREISIAEACSLHFKDIGHDPDNHDTTYENAQARERTQVLMDAANQMGGLVVGTGDLSELALGWATYNGDHMSMYGVNAGVPKTLIRHLVAWMANNLVDSFTKEVLLDIVATPISPELIPANSDGTIQQKTEDLVGPYELHDFFLFHVLRHGFRPRKIYWLACQAFEGSFTPDTIRQWLTTFYRRFFQQQFKRSCLPDGPKVGSCSLSPRSDWHMPSDASAELWLRECKALEE